MAGLKTGSFITKNLEQIPTDFHLQYPATKHQTVVMALDAQRYLKLFQVRLRIIPLAELSSSFIGIYIPDEQRRDRIFCPCYRALVKTLQRIVKILLKLSVCQ